MEFELRISDAPLAADEREGMESFTEKRKPSWKGR